MMRKLWRMRLRPQFNRRYRKSSGTWESADVGRQSERSHFHKRKLAEMRRDVWAKEKRRKSRILQKEREGRIFIIFYTESRRRI